MEVVKTIITSKSGTGVYIVKSVKDLIFGNDKKEVTRVTIHHVQIVFDNGYKTDYPINYENGNYGFDYGHSETTKKAVKRAFKYMYKNMLHITKRELLK
jgi:hypothetical protein